MIERDGGGESIGWIAICDVFLVGALAMLAAAAALGGQLQQTTDSAETLKKDAEAANDTIAALTEERDEFADRLRLEQQQRQEADNELDGADMLVAEANRRLEQARLVLATKNEELKQARAELEDKVAAYERAEEARKQAAAMLAVAESMLKTASDKLAAAERDLKVVSGKLTATELKLGEAKGKLAATAKELALARRQIVILTEGRLKDRKQFADYEGRIKGLDLDLDRAKDALRNVESVPKVILGLKGNLDRVVFVYDRSVSMKERWTHTRLVFLTWLRFLSVKQCAVVTFGHDVAAFPSEKTTGVVLKDGMLDLSAEHKDQNLRELENWLKDVEPDGTHTDTLAGLRAGYSRFGQVSTLVLFTDGEPTSVKIKTLPQLAEYKKAVVNECKQQYQSKQVVVNTVALGNYYKKPEFTSFLMDIAREGNGAFIGR